VTGPAGATRPTVCFTVDYEPDCPPWMTGTFRGVEEATAPLLAMLRARGVRATWFSTGDVAERYPDAVRALLADGHELGCHGHTHRRFDQLDAAAARWEVETASAVLRRHAPVRSFRAPNLAFPEAYLPLLAAAGYALDSSQARYKPATMRAAATPDGRPAAAPGLTRIPASVTSSVLRLARPVREGYLALMLARAADEGAPLVLFVHPWEFVDLRHTRLRLDCRFHTGPEAFARVGATLDWLAGRGARFVAMGDLARAA
jgi:peptidoglycan/xylan/chitin deacetylase (PgdA/CDA1 family)